MVQSAVEFFIHNNVVVIQFGFAIIFFLSVFVILKSFREENKTASTPAPKPAKKAAAPKEEVALSAPAQKASDDKNPLDDLDNLDDLMGTDDKTLTIPTPTPAPTVAATPAEAPMAAATPSPELQKVLEDKEKIISDLKNEMTLLQAKATAAPAANNQALEDKIKELSEKLSEYEIIEDDIANLSFYKSENVKLKNELEKVKGGPVELGTPPPIAAPSEPVPMPVATPEPVVAPIAKDNSVLEEFEKAVQQKEALEKNIETPAPESTPAPEATVTPLEVDSKKLVQEMETLSQAPAPVAAADDGKDSTQKLIEEFENFMNKASS